MIMEEDYFFFEWLILKKGMSEEAFSNLSHDELKILRAEWKVWFDNQ